VRLSLGRDCFVIEKSGVNPADAQGRRLEQMCDIRSVLNFIRTSMRETGSFSERSDYLNKWTRLSFRNEFIEFRCRDI